MTFSNNLRMLRKYAGYSAKQFAEEVGLKYPAYLRYEKAKSIPDSDILSKFADVLKVTPELLLNPKVANDFMAFETSLPTPCIRDQSGKIKKQTIKQLLMKIHEELLELEAAIGSDDYLDKSAENVCKKIKLHSDSSLINHIASEAADLKTAVTTFEEAIGISLKLRCKVQRAVNLSNKNKGRL